MTEAAPIRSERLELPLLTRPQMHQLLEGNVASVSQQIDARIPPA